MEVAILIHLLVLVLVFGIIVWIIGLIPIPQPFRTIAMAVTGLIFLLILLGDFGLLGSGSWRLR